MRRTTVLWETFVMRFEDVLSRYRRRRLTTGEAGELLGMSERHFRRLCGRYEEGVRALPTARSASGRRGARRRPACRRWWRCIASATAASTPSIVCRSRDLV